MRLSDLCPDAPGAKERAYKTSQSILQPGPVAEPSVNTFLSSSRVRRLTSRQDIEGWTVKAHMENSSLSNSSHLSFTPGTRELLAFGKFRATAEPAKMQDNVPVFFMDDWNMMVFSSSCNRS